MAEESTARGAEKSSKPVASPDQPSSDGSVLVKKTAAKRPATRAKKAEAAVDVAPLAEKAKPAKKAAAPKKATTAKKSSAKAAAPKKVAAKEVETVESPVVEPALAEAAKPRAKAKTTKTKTTAKKAVAVEAEAAIDLADRIDISDSADAETVVALDEPAQVQAIAPSATSSVAESAETNAAPAKPRTRRARTTAPKPVEAGATPESDKAEKKKAAPKKRAPRKPAAPKTPVIAAQIEPVEAETTVTETMVTEEIVTEEIVTEEVVAEAIVADEPVVEVPAVAETAVVEEHVVEEPAVQELAVQEPAVQELVQPRGYERLERLLAKSETIDTPVVVETPTAEEVWSGESVAQEPASEAPKVETVEETPQPVAQPLNKAHALVVESVPVPGRPRRSAGTIVVMIILVALALIVGLILGSSTNQKSDSNSTAAPGTTAAGAPTANAPTTNAPTAAPTATTAVAPSADASLGNTVMRLSGSANRQSALFELPAGAVRVRYNTTGGTLTVRLLTESGADNGDDFLCTSACDKEADLIKDAGKYYLDVQSSGGDWNVQVGI